jgi:isocitrate lyase
MTTQLTRQQQVDAIKKDWAENPRWKAVKRPFTAEEVVALRGSVVPENTIAKMGAARKATLTHLVHSQVVKQYNKQKRVLKRFTYQAGRLLLMLT